MTVCKPTLLNIVYDINYINVIYFTIRNTVVKYNFAKTLNLKK